jgi:hypothetical protein
VVALQRFVECAASQVGRRRIVGQGVEARALAGAARPAEEALVGVAGAAQLFDARVVGGCLAAAFAGLGRRRCSCAGLEPPPVLERLSRVLPC